MHGADTNLHLKIFEESFPPFFKVNFWSEDVSGLRVAWLDTKSKPVIENR